MNITQFKTISSFSLLAVSPFSCAAAYAVWSQWSRGGHSPLSCSSLNFTGCPPASQLSWSAPLQRSLPHTGNAHIGNCTSYFRPWVRERWRSMLEAGSQPLPDFQTSHKCTFRQPGSCLSRHQAPRSTVCRLRAARAPATLPPACLLQHALREGCRGELPGPASWLPQNPSLPSRYLQVIKGTQRSTGAVLQSLKLLKICLMKVYRSVCELQRTPSCFSYCFSYCS